MSTVSVYRSQCGFTLVELMVAIVLALVVSAAVTAVFVSSKKAYVTQDKLARVQENGRFAMHYLMQDVRMAKHMGCLKSVVNVVRVDLQSTPNDFVVGSHTGVDAVGLDPKIKSTDPFAIPIEGIDNYVSSSTWAPSNMSVSALALNPAPRISTGNYSTDMLIIRRSATLARVDAAMTTVSAPVKVDSVDRLRKNQIVMVANCDRGDVFQISDIDPTTKTVQHGTTGDTNFVPGNWTAEFAKNYGDNDGAEILQILTHIYYVANNPNGVPSLYRWENGIATELIEGIESLQVLYGIRSSPTSKQPVRYMPAASVAPNWGSVVSVKIGILTRTSGQDFGDMNTTVYNVNGTDIGPFNDRHERRVFEATVSLKSVAL